MTLAHHPHLHISCATPAALMHPQISLFGTPTLLNHRQLHPLRASGILRRASISRLSSAKCDLWLSQDQLTSVFSATLLDHIHEIAPKGDPIIAHHLVDEVHTCVKVVRCREVFALRSSVALLFTLKALLILLGYLISILSEEPLA